MPRVRHGQFTDVGGLIMEKRSFSLPLSDSDRATLMGGALQKIYGWSPKK